MLQAEKTIDETRFREQRKLDARPACVVHPGAIFSVENDQWAERARVAFAVFLWDAVLCNGEPAYVPRMFTRTESVV